MKKLFTFSLSFIFLHQTLAQQVPQFVMTPPLSLATTGALMANRHGVWGQHLYYSSDFPIAPAGHITRLYIQATSPLVTAMHIGNFAIKMGYMQAGENGDTMHFNHVAPLSFCPTDTVLFSSNYFVDTPIKNGDWVGFTLHKPFYYNASSNFIVEWHHDSLDIYYGFQSMGAITPAYRCYSRNKNPSGTWNPVVVSGGVQYIGFDLQPTDVNDVRSLSSLVLYPNPTNDNVTLRWDAGKSVKDLSVTITNVTGAVIWRHNYANASNSFSKMIDVSQLPRGMYLVEIKANGEKLARKLALQ